MEPQFWSVESHAFSIELSYFCVAHFTGTDFWNNRELQTKILNILLLTFLDIFIKLDFFIIIFLYILLTTNNEI